MATATTAGGGAASAHPFALDADAHERKALRFKVFAFYAKWEPKKSVEDVNDLCEWALENGIAAFNKKLISKYGEDLSTITVNSYVDLPLEAQLKLFYAEYDPRKPQREIDEVALWARGRPTGLQEVNVRMEKKYGENLNTFAFGGRLHMRGLMAAYLTKVDPAGNKDPATLEQNVNKIVQLAVTDGPLVVMQSLVKKYNVPIHLSVAEIQGRGAETVQIPLGLDKSVTGGKPLDAPRPAVMSLLRSDQQKAAAAVAQPPPPQAQGRPLSVALSVGSVATKKLTVSEDAEIRGLIEIFYAKHNPEKLAASEIDKLMKYVRMQGLEALNIKLKDRYGQDIDELKVEYADLIQTLVRYYQVVDPSKTKVDDIAAWAIVHGVEPLSERLEKRYGRPLLLDDILDPPVLRARVEQFYRLYDPTKPKSSEDIDTIVSWVLAGSVKQLNAKLREKYGKCLEDLPPLEVGEAVPIPPAVKAGGAAAGGGGGGGVAPTTKSTVGSVNSAVPAPETLGVKTNGAGGAVTQARKPSIVPPAGAKPPHTGNTPPATPTPKEPAKATSMMRDRSDSFGGDFRSVAEENSMDQIDEQVKQMRISVHSGTYDNLASQIRAFYKEFDKEKLENKEALDLVLKWTFKHGVKALNEKFQKHYGHTLDAVKGAAGGDDDDDDGDDLIGVEVPNPDW